MMADAPITLERDGDVARRWCSHNPPLNLFGDDAFEALIACIDEVEGSDARALVWRAEGEIFTGGVDVNASSGSSMQAAERRATGRPADRRACSGSRRCRSRRWPWSTGSA